MTEARERPADSTAGSVPDLDLREITKHFGTTTALDSASLQVSPRSIHALLGENGAGKTTFMRIAFGMLTPDAGTIRVRGGLVRFSSPSDAIAARIGMVHQQFSLIPEMSVAENVALGGHGRYDIRQVSSRVLEIAAHLGMTLNPATKVKDLTASERQKLEIVRTFAHRARTLILDEPTAVLTSVDIGDLFLRLRSFADSGGSVVLITHKLQDALKHADEVTVLRKGRCVLKAPIGSVSETILADAMLGRGQNSPAKREEARSIPNRPVVQLANVTVKDDRGIEQLSRVSLHINAGEIVGVAALEGAAKPMLELIAGRTNQTSGDVVRPPSVGFVPEDRIQDSIIPEFSLAENTALRNSASRSGRMNWPQIQQVTETILSDFDVRAPGPDACIASLSGGNQQKFVLGRELSDKPALLVLENPTQGLDVHAASAIHDKIRTARDEGTAIVVYSSDLDELAVLSDRVIVIKDGAISFTDPDPNLIGRALLSTTLQ